MAEPELSPTPPGPPDGVERRAACPSPNKSVDSCSRLDDVHDRLGEVKVRLDKGDGRFDCIERKLDTNNKDTAEMLDILHLGKSFFRILGIIGSIVKWGAGIAAAVFGLWFTLKGK